MRESQAGAGQAGAGQAGAGQADAIQLHVADPASAVMSTAAAARALSIEPGTLRLWELQYGFPASTGRDGGHRGFTRVQITSLREELLRSGSVSAAICLTRQRYEVARRSKPANT